MGIIKLESSDWSDVLRFSNHSGENLRKAFMFLIKKKLRYNTITGKTYIGRELVQEFTHKQDIPKDYTREDYLRWMFMGEINNATQLLDNGYNLNGRWK